MRRCRHQWEEAERWAVEPNIEFNAERISATFLPTLRDAMFGFTTIVLKCSLCGDVASRKLEGVR